MHCEEGRRDTEEQASQQRDATRIDKDGNAGKLLSSRGKLNDDDPTGKPGRSADGVTDDEEEDQEEPISPHSEVPNWDRSIMS